MFEYMSMLLFCLLNSSTAAAGAKASVTFQITPEVRGQKKEASLVITAESDQIKGIMGAVNILIVWGSDPIHLNLTYVYLLLHLVSTVSAETSFGMCTLIVWSLNGHL